MKKAQVQQVFIYLMAIIVIGAILLLALRAILGITGEACDIEKIKFKEEIEDTLNRYTRHGNRGFETIRVPCKDEQLCFVDLEERACNQITTNEVIRGECEAGTNENVFIIRDGFTEALFSIPTIAVDEPAGYFCISPRNNRYHLILEGIGRGKVQVAPDNP